MKDKITSIAIVFDDNDFGNTFINLMNTVKNILYYNKTSDRVVLTKIILEGCRFHYIAFQNQYDYKNVWATHEEHFDFIEQYLRTGIKVFFNEEEANAKYFNEDHDSTSYHLDVASGQINCF